MYKISLNSIKRRICVSFLDLLILSELSKSNFLSGYDVLKLVMHNYKIELSASTVYHFLKKMEKDELIRRRLDSRKIMYSLTQKGDKTLKDAVNWINELGDFMTNLLHNDIQHL